MMADAGATIHASAVLVGAKAALIRGPAGAGKSRLVLALLQMAEAGALTFARLVGDDRIHAEASHGRLLVRPAAQLAGLLEVRGLGIRRFAFEPVAVARLVIDLGAEGAERLPKAGEQETTISGIRLPRLAVASGTEPLQPVLVLLRTMASGN